MFASLQIWHSSDHADCWEQSGWTGPPEEIGRARSINRAYRSTVHWLIVLKVDRMAQYGCAEEDHMHASKPEPEAEMNRRRLPTRHYEILCSGHISAVDQ